MPQIRARIKTLRRLFLDTLADCKPPDSSEIIVGVLGSLGLSRGCPALALSLLSLLLCLLLMSLESPRPQWVSDGLRSGRSGPNSVRGVFLSDPGHCGCPRNPYPPRPVWWVSPIHPCGCPCNPHPPRPVWWVSPIHPNQMGVPNLPGLHAQIISDSTPSDIRQPLSRPAPPSVDRPVVPLCGAAIFPGSPACCRRSGPVFR
jgi:hypothetical protein